MYSKYILYNLLKINCDSLSILCYLRKRVHNLLFFLIFLKFFKYKINYIFFKNILKMLKIIKIYYYVLKMYIKNDI